MAEIKPVVEVDHNPEEDWHQWVFLNGFRGREVVVHRDSLGRRRHTVWREWLVLHCNNGQCSAKGIVPLTMIHDLMESAAPVPVEAQGTT